MQLIIHKIQIHILIVIPVIVFRPSNLTITGVNGSFCHLIRKDFFSFQERFTHSQGCGGTSDIVHGLFSGTQQHICPSLIGLQVGSHIQLHLWSLRCFKGNIITGSVSCDFFTSSIIDTGNFVKSFYLFFIQYFDFLSGRKRTYKFRLCTGFLPYINPAFHLNPGTAGSIFIIRRFRLRFRFFLGLLLLCFS